MEWVGFASVVVAIIIGSFNISDRIEKAVEHKVEFVLDKWGLIDRKNGPSAYPNGSTTLQGSLNEIYQLALTSIEKSELAVTTEVESTKGLHDSIDKLKESKGK